ncbi:LOB domain-containing protein 37-like [Panicum miliaceum]|uniref:LOB domain-containing protein 37-like n=1 Tax=Panicum miliaceum TaxID=4540 RepID=A0A3L6T9H2_PANMI|nr:LOB domain-containing protein 37-like [Panicum miliaceum]
MAELEGWCCMRGGPPGGGRVAAVVLVMSCNGCRVLRKGCSEACVLRPCLQWIEGAEAQGHATIFVAKFFGRAGLMSFLTAVPEPQRPGKKEPIGGCAGTRFSSVRSRVFTCACVVDDAAVFRSLLYEAAGRTINPVSGAVGLLGAGSWHLCQAAVETVLRGGGIRPLPELDGGLPLTARRAVAGCSTFSTAKRAAARANAGALVAAYAFPEPSCDLGLCLSPGSPLAPGEQRPGTPSMTSEESVTTSSGGSGGREPELLNLFV